MLKFTLFLLVITQFNAAFAAPTSAKEINLGELFAKLAKQCEHKFISRQILNNIEECNIKITPQYNPTQIKCLSFYEISSRMCSEKTLIINDEISKKLNEPVSVSEICNSASAWKFTELGLVQDYKEIFHNNTICSKICEIEYITYDSSFFCKYYNWGSLLLEKTHNIPKPTAVEDIKIVPKVPVIKIVPPEDNVSQKVEKKVDEVIAETGVKDISTKVIMEAAAKENEQTSTSESNTAQNLTSNPIEKSELKGDKVKMEPIKNDEAQILPKDTNPASNMSNADINSLKQKDQQAPSLDKPNLPSEQDSYDADDTEDEERIIGLSPDDGEDLPEVIKEDKKKTLTDDSYIRTEINDKNEEEVVFSKTPFKDIYPPGDQDQFLTYLVTGVVLVVLLYVLYHNKGKVTKVVLGLIVEGRQSTRRRNSRGHAYKRLDTLEQAISTNPARAPTKIIY